VARTTSTARRHCGANTCHQPPASRHPSPTTNLAKHQSSGTSIHTPVSSYHYLVLPVPPAHTLHALRFIPHTQLLAHNRLLHPVLGTLLPQQHCRPAVMPLTAAEHLKTGGAAHMRHTQQHVVHNTEAAAWCSTAWTAPHCEHIPVQACTSTPVCKHVQAHPCASTHSATTALPPLQLCP
jgi:hypothetical protein